MSDDRPAIKAAIRGRRVPARSFRTLPGSPSFRTASGLSATLRERLAPRTGSILADVVKAAGPHGRHALRPVSQALVLGFRPEARRIAQDVALPAGSRRGVETILCETYLMAWLSWLRRDVAREIVRATDKALAVRMHLRRACRAGGLPVPDVDPLPSPTPRRRGRPGLLGRARIERALRKLGATKVQAEWMVGRAARPWTEPAREKEVRKPSISPTKRRRAMRRWKRRR